MEPIDKENEKKVALIKLLTKVGYTEEEIKEYYYRRAVRLEKEKLFNEQKRSNPKRSIRGTA